MKLTELMSKDIINDEDGAKLGKIIDLELDTTTGKIQNVIINQRFRLNNLFSNKEAAFIPYNKILKIGNDVIIVDYPKKINKITTEN